MLSFLGIIITSDEVISVHSSTLTTQSNYGTFAPDAVILRPVTHTSYEFFLAGYDVMNTAQPM